MNSDYILADDLSGALEAGAAFRARSTTPVILSLGAAGPAAPAGLRVLNSGTRNAPPSEAAATVGRLLAALRPAGGGRLVFKKIDSTLRGPVGAEIKALVEALAPPLVVVCPANPAVGRTVRDGLLLVDGVPVADTEFRRDSGWPVTESRIAAVLEGGGIKRVGALPLARLRQGGALQPQDCHGVLVCDAETEDDLARLVSLVRQREPRAVFVGAGGLAHALAASTVGAVIARPPLRIDAGSRLFVSGSMREVSRKQLEMLRDVHRVPMHEIGLEAGSERALAGQLGQSLKETGCASLTIAAHARPAEPGEPVRKLVAVIRLLAAAGAIPEMLAATGGETAEALCAALDIRQLELVQEFQRGVVIAMPIGLKSLRPKYVVIKPGGFGSTDAWAGLIPDL